MNSPTEISVSTQLLLVEIRKLFDEQAAKWDRRFADRDAARDQQLVSRGSSLSTPVVAMEATVAADNWGGLFDGGDAADGAEFLASSATTFVTQVTAPSAATLPTDFLADTPMFLSARAPTREHIHSDLNVDRMGPSCCRPPSQLEQHRADAADPTRLDPSSPPPLLLDTGDLMPYSVSTPLCADGTDVNVAPFSLHYLNIWPPYISARVPATEGVHHGCDGIESTITVRFIPKSASASVTTTPNISSIALLDSAPSATPGNVLAASTVSAHWVFDEMPKRYIMNSTQAHLIGVVMSGFASETYGVQSVFKGMISPCPVLFCSLPAHVIKTVSKVPWPPPLQDHISLLPDICVLCLTLFRELVMKKPWPPPIEFEFLIVGPQLHVLGFNQDDEIWVEMESALTFSPASTISPAPASSTEDATSGSSTGCSSVPPAENTSQASFAVLYCMDFTMASSPAFMVSIFIIFPEYEVFEKMAETRNSWSLSKHFHLTNIQFEVLMLAWPPPNQRIVCQFRKFHQVVGSKELILLHEQPRLYCKSTVVQLLILLQLLYKVQCSVCVQSTWLSLMECCLAANGFDNELISTMLHKFPAQLGPSSCGAVLRPKPWPFFIYYQLVMKHEEAVEEILILGGFKFNHYSRCFFVIFLNFIYFKLGYRWTTVACLFSYSHDYVLGWRLSACRSRFSEKTLWQFVTLATMSWLQKQLWPLQASSAGCAYIQDPKCSRLSCLISEFNRAAMQQKLGSSMHGMDSLAENQLTTCLDSSRILLHLVLSVKTCQATKLVIRSSRRGGWKAVIRLQVLLQTANGHGLDTADLFGYSIDIPHEMPCTRILVVGSKFTMVCNAYKEAEGVKELFLPWDPGGTELLHRLGGKPNLKMGGMLGMIQCWADLYSPCRPKAIAHKQYKGREKQQSKA